MIFAAICVIFEHYCSKTPGIAAAKFDAEAAHLGRGRRTDMPKLNISVQHKLPQDEALKRIKKALPDLKTDLANYFSDLHEDWDGNTCEFRLKVLGFPVSGTMNAKPSEVEISGNLPFVALPFKGKIESTIRERLKQLLA